MRVWQDVRTIKRFCGSVLATALNLFKPIEPILVVAAISQLYLDINYAGHIVSVLTNKWVGITSIQINAIV